jgi:L-lysine 2,3-aminomutase
MRCGKETGGESGGGVSFAEWNDWKWQFRNRVRSLRQLASVLNRSIASLAACGPVLRTYPMAITPYYLSLLNPADENDPLRRQCFPDPRELTFSGADPPLSRPLSCDRHRNLCRLLQALQSQADVAHG